MEHFFSDKVVLYIVYSVYYVFVNMVIKVLHTHASWIMPMASAKCWILSAQTLISAMKPLHIYIMGLCSDMLFSYAIF